MGTTAGRTAQGTFAKGNRCSLRNGLFALGKLPAGCAYLRKLVGRFRAALTRAVRDRDGRLTVGQEALISTACRKEAQALLLLRWLREEGARLTVPERAALLRDLTNASAFRDACIQRLGLSEPGTVEPDLLALFQGPADGPGSPGDPDAG